MSHRLRLSSQLIIVVLLLVGSSFAASCCTQLEPQAADQKPTAKAGASPSVQSPLPPPTGHVNDYAHALDDGLRIQIEQALAELKVRSQIEFAIAIVNTTGGQPIFDYSLAVGRGWGVGGPVGDGILLLIAIDDRQWRIQTSRKLERDLPDTKVKEAGEVMKAPFREGHYGEGVRRCVEELIKILAARRGFAPIRIPAPLLRG